MKKQFSYKLELNVDSSPCIVNSKERNQRLVNDGIQDYFIELTNLFYHDISMGECDTILSAYTKYMYRHLG